MLVLDDLGTELDGERFAVVFGELVEARQNAKTVITTNLAPAELRRRYGDRIADRLNHLGRIVPIVGASRRRGGGI